MDYVLNWIQVLHSSYPLAVPLAYVGLHVLLAAMILPCSPMTLLAGVLWGGAYGLALSMAGAILSCAATFLLARRFLHARIERLITQRYPKLAWIMAEAVAHDWKLIAVMQLNPLIPASSLGYAFGLSRVSLLRYLLFSTAFMLPLQILFVMTGQSITSLLASRESSGPALILVVLIVALSLAGKPAYRKLSKRLGINDGA